MQLKQITQLTNNRTHKKVFRSDVSAEIKKSLL